jgi:hypothetical protein
MGFRFVPYPKDFRRAAVELLYRSGKTIAQRPSWMSRRNGMSPVVLPVYEPSERA